jgi:hypothetical protein
MKIFFAGFAACFFLLLSPVFGQSQKIIPLSSGIYGEMDALYLLRGLATPSAARPWTANEAAEVLKKIEPHSLNQGESALYNHIAAEISRPLRVNADGAFSFDARLDLALEAYAHTNADDFVLNEDWNYGYVERQPAAKLSLEMNLYSGLYICTDLMYNRNRFNGKDEFRSVQDTDQGIGAETSLPDSYIFPRQSWAYSKPFITNVPTGTDEFDFDWPKRANITAGGRYWNISIARDRIQWGRGYSGNFVFDGHRDYDEYFRFSAFSEKFKYEWLNVFYPGKLLMAHRLEFRLLPSLAFAVSENIMCVSDAFNPRYINPAFIFHNWYDRDNINAIAQLEFDFVPFKGYRLYTQAAFDQIRAPWEDDSESAAWGVIAGIEHARPALRGIMSFSLECAYTTPLLYRRDLVDFITMSDTKVNNAEHSIAIDYTGYPYGGDALVIQLDANYRFPGSALIHARLFGMIHGSMNFFASHNKDGNNTGAANLKDQTPSGSEDEQEHTLGISLGANYALPQRVSWHKISVWTDLSYIVKKNKLMISAEGTGENIIYHKEGVAQDFQIALGVGISF